MQQLSVCSFPYSRPANKFLVKALREAKQLIRDGRESYVCLALNEVRSRNSDVRIKNATDYLRSYVREKLGTHSVLEGWQAAKGLETITRDGKADRIKWINWMLKELV